MKGGFKNGYRVLELSYARIAVATQERTNGTCRVIVINAQMAGRIRLKTDRTEIALRHAHRVVLGLRQSVTTKQKMPSPSGSIDRNFGAGVPLPVT
jgi:hypothetical protein